jgi:hypothetical protein
MLRGLAQGIDDSHHLDRAPRQGADKIHQLPAVNSDSASVDVFPEQQSPLDIEHILQQRIRYGNVLMPFSISVSGPEQLLL